jgi:hypothetical protein
MALLIVLVGVSIAPAVRAQDHAEVGAFVDYFRSHETGANFAGLGGRAAINIVPNVQIEAEMAYDFNQVFTEDFTNTGTGAVTVQRSNMRILHGMFGPKFQTTGPVRVFVTLKGGFADFRFDSRPATFATFTSSADSLRADNMNATLYPGGGVEAFLGPFGVRIDVGDEMIFAHRISHNWKITFGPQIRF